MTLRNSVLLVDEVPSTNLRNVVVDNGVETSLAPIILVLDNRSRIYLCSDKKNPDFVEITSIHKKKLGCPMSFKEN